MLDAVVFRQRQTCIAARRAAACKPNAASGEAAESSPAVPKAQHSPKYFIAVRRRTHPRNQHGRFVLSRPAGCSQLLPSFRVARTQEWTALLERLKTELHLVFVSVHACDVVIVAVHAVSVQYLFLLCLVVSVATDSIGAGTCAALPSAARERF
jgi:hypothetical protein